jgi:hypothetical protein
MGSRNNFYNILVSKIIISHFFGNGKGQERVSSGGFDLSTPSFISEPLLPAFLQPIAGLEV